MSAKELNSDSSPAKAFSHQFIIYSIVVIIFGIPSALGYYHHKEEIQRTIKANKATANSLAGIILEHQRAADGVMQSCARHPLLIAAAKKRDFHEALTHLAHLKENNPDIDTIFITDPNGNLWVDFPVHKESHGVNFSYWDWYRGVSKDWKPYVSSVYKRLVGPKDVALVVAFPIFDEGDRLIGILVAVEPASSFEKAIQAIPTDPGIKVTLIDQIGHIIYSNRFPLGKDVTPFPPSPFLDQARRGEKGEMEYPDPAEGDRVKYVAFAPVGGIGWSVIVEKGRREILAGETEYFILNAMISSLLFVISVLSVGYFRKRFIIMRMAERQKAEESFREKNETLQTLIQASPLAIVTLDRDANVKMWSPAAERIFGWSGKEILGFPLPLVPEEKQNEFRDLLQKVFNGEGFTGAEVRRQKKDGSLIDVTISAAPFQDRKGNVAGVMAVIEDISQRKWAEETLQKSEQEAKQLAQENAVMAEIGRIVSSTINVEDVYERFAEEVRKIITFDRIGINIINPEEGFFTLTYVTGVDIPAYRQGAVMALKGTVTERLLTNRSGLIAQAETEEELKIIFPSLLQNFKAGLRSMMMIPLFSKDQVIATLHIQSLQIKAYTEGDLRIAQKIGNQIVGAIANAQLFAERKQAEGALKRERDRAQKYLDIGGVILLAIDVDQRVSLINKKGCEILGYTEEEIIGQNWFDNFLPGRERESVRAVFAQLVAGEAGHGEYVENPILTKNGEERVVAWRNTIFTDEGGKVTATFSSGEDITERKGVENKIKESLKEKEALLKEIHHRVKNNLQVISSLLNWQCRYIRDPSALEMFRESQNRVKLMALIHEKLYQAKDMAKINFGEYIESLSNHIFHSYQTGGREISLQIDMQEIFLGIDQAIPCGMVINELISNSFKHAFPPSSKGQISISLKSDGGDRLLLAVKDTGVGFPQDLDFRSAESLGMQLLNVLTCQLEGTIELDCRNGTEFRITFPA